MLHPRQTGFLMAPQPWVNSKSIEIDEEVGSGRVVHRKSPGKSTVDGTGGLLAPKQACVCKCARKLTLKSSGVVVEWCGALKTPGESMEMRSRGPRGVGQCAWLLVTTYGPHALTNPTVV